MHAGGGGGEKAKPFLRSSVKGNEDRPLPLRGEERTGLWRRRWLALALEYGVSVLFCFFERSLGLVWVRGTLVEGWLDWLGYTRLGSW